MKKASPALEAYIDETIKRSRERGYNPTVFIGMRSRHGTIEAASRLVQSGDIQSGFHKLHQLGLLDYTIERTIEMFAGEFTRSDLECAQFRLRLVRQGE